MGRVALTEKVTYAIRLKGNEADRHADIWGKSTVNRKKNKCKIPELGACLVCLGNIKEASVVGAESDGGSWR